MRSFFGLPYYDSLLINLTLPSGARDGGRPRAVKSMDDNDTIRRLAHSWNSSYHDATGPSRPRQAGWILVWNCETKSGLMGGLREGGQSHREKREGRLHEGLSRVRVGRRRHKQINQQASTQRLVGAGCGLHR